MKVMMWWRNLRIARQIQLVGLAIVILFCLQYAWIFPRIKANLMEVDKLAIKDSVETASGVIDYYRELVQKGELRSSEAKELAAKVISSIRYDKTNYFWIQDTSPRMIMHPIKPEMNGKDVSQEADPTGKKLFVEFANMARSQGEGFVDYQWPKPNETKPSPKVSYVKYFPEWDWVIGSGIYVDDVNAMTWALFKPILLITLFVAIAGFLLAHFAAAAIAKPVNQLADTANELALGNIDVTVSFESTNEIGNLATAFRRLAGYMQELSNNVLQISKGDTQVEVQPKSNKDIITRSVGRLINTLRDLLSEGKLLISAAIEGQLNIRADASKFEGGYKELIEGINQTLDAVTRPIDDASLTLEKISARDLTARIMTDYKGEYAKIRESLNSAADNLQTGLLQVNVASEQVASAAEQIASSSQSLAQGASEQASSLEEISSNMQEIGSMAKQNAASVEEGKKIAEVAREQTEAGAKAMEKMSNTINKIKASSDETAKIVKTIDEIAFQTNLLALNAAVEAARAGDAGKGFAVVAEEVRNLAMRSAEAAKQTADMIAESVKNSEEGVLVNQEVSANLQKIYEQVNRVNEVMAEITAASKQQTQGIEQASEALSQLEKITQQNAATSEEMASTAQEMTSQAAELKRLTSSFKLDENGNGNGQGTPTGGAKPMTAKPNEHVSDRASVGKTKKEKVGAATRKPSSPDPASVIPLDEDTSTLESF